MGNSTQVRRGLYTHEIRIPIKGGMTIPNIATFDHGTNEPQTTKQLVDVENSIL